MSWGHKYKSVRWEEASNGYVPEGAVQGGWDLEDDTIYVGRAHYGGNVIPGELVPSCGVCYVPYGGKEIGKDHYEVLCNSHSCKLEWESAENGEIPNGAIQGGVTNNGEKLFIGRVSHVGTLTVGTVHPSHGCLYIPYGGGEHSYTEYEILVCRE